MGREGALFNARTLTTLLVACTRHGKLESGYDGKFPHIRRDSGGQGQVVLKASNGTGLVLAPAFEPRLANGAVKGAAAFLHVESGPFVRVLAVARAGSETRSVD